MKRSDRTPLKLVLPVEGETPAPRPEGPALTPRAEGPSLTPRPEGPALTPQPPLPQAGEGEPTAPVEASGEPTSVEVSPVHSSPDALRPRFVPLALAIDMGQTGPIGSLTTTTVEINPSAGAPSPSEARPLAGARREPAARRRHLRLLPDP